ncbi:unnamed protein product [Blumeria hordei]|uniref:Uncharacterized protein n=1 Tax=Blumeria hordei TaxID=2867405 RepID=A0A383UMI2_BLUHO|nr:unnamed protein product [Blumeria hordei]
MELTSNQTCNTTLEVMRIGGSEVALIGNLSFHDLGVIVAASAAAIAIMTSLYLIFMHATHYTKPNEQRHIIRILFMVPIYSTSALLSFMFYWHAIYFQVLSDCYEAFAIASFFALLCHYIAPNLHEQKKYFRSIEPKAWVWPVDWFKLCCIRVWRTPRNGLTWFNIIWSGVYQYCFIRVAMTIVAVVTQYYGRYCESSHSPVFAHIWVLVIEGSAVTIAMYCIVQFYIQLSVELEAQKPFIKVLAIKLVIFLSFWQTFLISILTSEAFQAIKPNPTISYPDLKVGIPSLLLCIEMAVFSILHLFAFSYKQYVSEPSTMSSLNDEARTTIVGPNQGGPAGLLALADAMNPWDLVKGFARAIPWLLVGHKQRDTNGPLKSSETDLHLHTEMSLEPQHSRQNSLVPVGPRRPSRNVVINNSGIKNPAFGPATRINSRVSHTGPYVPARQRYDNDGYEITTHAAPGNHKSLALDPRDDPFQNHVIEEPFTSESISQAYLVEKRIARQNTIASSPTRQSMGADEPKKGDYD